MAENNCSEQTAPLDAAAAAKAAFGEVAGEPFPKDIYAAPQLTWAVIGCGVIANQMATSLALSGRHLRGVANRTREKAEAFAERYGVERVYDSVEELYQDPSVDAIYITTPHNNKPIPNNFKSCFLFLFFPFLANSSGFDHYSELFIGKFRTIFIRHHRSVFQCFKHFYLFFSQWNGKIEFMFNEHNPFVFCFSCIPCRDPCQANMLGISVFSSSCHPRP